jgi:thioester reductase-like protein
MLQSLQREVDRGSNRGLRSLVRLSLLRPRSLAQHVRMLVGHGHEADGVLLTGATGFLGAELLARYLERTDRTVYVLVRAGTQDGAERRLRSVLEGLPGDTDAYVHRAIALRGDLCRPGLGLTPARWNALAEAVTDVVHCAASISFELPLADAREINVEGTRQLLELAAHAQRRGGLRSFSHVSTAYVSGDWQGPFSEDDFAAGQEFRNTYERSKFESELLVREHALTLPVQIFRPSIVVGDSRSGYTNAFNVIYSPLGAFARGAYSAIPGRAAAPVDVVPVDFVADAIFGLAGRPGTVHHLTAGAHATTLGELIELATGYFDQPRPRLVPPGLYRRVAHPLLLRRAKGARRKALERSEIYFPYFDAQVEYESARTSAALRPLGIEVPPIGDYFERLMEFAQSCEWGRAPLARSEATGPGPLVRPWARDGVAA